MEFLLPPVTKNEKGEIRKVGFEIEFGGIELYETAQIVAQIFKGDIRQKNHFAYKVINTEFGDFEIESDARFLSQEKYTEYLKKIGIDHRSPMTENVEKVLEKLAGTLLPFEIAMPPFPMDKLERAEELRRELFRHSAVGTRSNLFAAFGMQFNPELPDFRVETILSYMRAFFLLFDWLYEESNIVLARKIAPYIHPFPQDYVDLIIDPDYQPSLSRFTQDYLEHNPTRNRPLDLLPLLTYLDKELVFQYPVEKHLIKPRPTFHYRLPNSEIDDPNWSFAKEWNKWVRVENLAYNSELLNKMSREYLYERESSIIFSRTQWILKSRDLMNVHR